MFIAGSRHDTHYTGPILTDPSLVVYRAAQLKRGISASYVPALIFRTVRALRRGFRQVGTRCDEILSRDAPRAAVRRVQPLL